MSNEKNLNIHATSTANKEGNAEKEIICPKCGCREIIPANSPCGFKHECVFCYWTF